MGDIMLYRSGKLIAIAGLLLALAACGPLGPPPRTTVDVIGDKFSKEIELQGVPLHDPTNGVDLFWMLRSFVNPKTHETFHTIYVEWVYGGHSLGRFHATDDTARDLVVKVIERDACPFGKCDRTDTLAIAIDEATLRKRAATGFQVKLFAQDGSSGILDITTQMINAQLQAEDRIYSAPAGVSPLTAAAAANARTADGKGHLGIVPFDLPFGVGVQINRVDPNTPAAAAGFEIGDLVLSYNGQKVTGADQLTGLIQQTVPGTLVPIEIKRHQQPMTLSAQM
jgi:hypothetical protein